MYSAYNSIKSKLLETGLYRLDGSTLIDAEILAYSAAIDMLLCEIEGIKNTSLPQLFPQKLLDEFVKITGTEKLGLSYEKKREMITAWLSFSFGSKEEIERIISSFGLDTELTFDGSRIIISVKLIPQSNMMTEDELKQLIRKFLPLHVETEFIFPHQ